jgi:hypothetical protein
MKPQIVFIPGLGADSRLFEAQQKAFPNAVTPPWLAPLKDETLAHYAKRWAQHLRLKRLCVSGHFFRRNGGVGNGRVGKASGRSVDRQLSAPFQRSLDLEIHGKFSSLA